jgi:crossover junction endodeoxyribonuclease RuvC
MHNYIRAVQDKERIILGIDPGTQVLGYGIIRIEAKNHNIISVGVVKLDKFSDHGVRLKKIFERITELIDSYSPTEMALEAPFFGKNVQSMLKLGRAQGVAMSAGLMRGLSIEEYAPRKVKQSITGNGNASKEQVALMLQRIFTFEEMPRYMDATDGLAVAYCHYLASTNILKQHARPGKPLKAKNSKTSWGEFIRANNDRVLK